MTHLFYVASPYSKYDTGIQAAYEDVSKEMALLLMHKVPCFSPIGHTHGIAVFGGIEPKDHSVWLPFDQPFMNICTGIIVLKMKGWAESYGVAYEIDQFAKAGKPRVDMTPGEVPAEFLPGGAFYAG